MGERVRRALLAAILAAVLLVLALLALDRVDAGDVYGAFAIALLAGVIAW